VVKKGNRYFTPLTFNLVAVIWIVGFLPLAVAFVSNIGSDPSNDEWERMSKPQNDLLYGDGKTSLAGDPLKCGNYFNCTGSEISWVSNGDDYSWAYRLNNPNLTIEESDCLYIADGVCKGGIDLNKTEADAYGAYASDCDQSGLYNPFGGSFYFWGDVAQYNCKFADPYWSYFDMLSGNTYNFEMTYDGSWFYRGQDTHFEINNVNPALIADDSYVGDSGEVFEIRLNELMMDNIPAGEMVDQIRLTFFDYPEAPLANPVSHNCNNYAGWANLSIETTLKQEFDGKYNELSSTYTTLTDNKFFLEAQPTYFTSGCYIGYEVLIDLNGFDTREMFNFANGGKWNQSNLFIQMKIEREDGLPLGSTNYAFGGVDDFAFAIDFTVIDSQQVEFSTNLGLIAMGGSNVVLAMASTPYWDPFKNFFKGRL
jgi:hypothetical protein